MRNVYLFCTRIAVYLTELPILILLWSAMKYNSESEELFKLYPLIVTLSFAVIFILVYFFRLISVSRDEIRYLGVFSSRDSALITEGKTLVVKLLKRRRIRIELYDDAAREPAFEWMKAEDAIHRDVCVFRGKAIGSGANAIDILTLFSVPRDIAKDVIDGKGEYEDENVCVTSERRDQSTEFKIKFKTTII